MFGGRLGLERDEADLETKFGETDGAGVGDLEVKVVLSLDILLRKFTNDDIFLRTLKLALMEDCDVLMKLT